MLPGWEVEQITKANKYAVKSWTPKMEARGLPEIPCVASVKIDWVRNSLAVQCLGLRAFTAMACVQPLIRELRSHKLASHKMWPKKKRQNRLDQVV